jgi:hypothetical protein
MLGRLQEPAAKVYWVACNPALLLNNTVSYHFFRIIRAFFVFTLHELPQGSPKPVRLCNRLSRSRFAKALCSCLMTCSPRKISFWDLSERVSRAEGARLTLVWREAIGWQRSLLFRRFCGVARKPVIKKRADSKRHATFRQKPKTCSSIENR